MATEASEPEGTEPRSPYLQALVATQVPVDQVIAQAETLGYNPEQLLGLGEDLAGDGRGSLAALALVLGAADQWRAFVPRALACGLSLIEPLLRPCCLDLDPLAGLLEQGERTRLYRRILQRLGYPMHPSGAAVLATVLPWLERGRALVLDRLELAGFASRSGAWEPLLIDTLILRDGTGPLRLGLAPGEPVPDGAGDRGLRLHRVGRLQALEGLQHLAILVAEACPDLESLDVTPPVLVLKGCPGVRQIRAHPRSRLLHLEDCPALRSIGAARVWDGASGLQVTPTYQSLVLADCAALRSLPDSLHVAGPMILRGMGPIPFWPSDFRVGGDLLLQDCPRLGALPALEVQGSLKVTGPSGIRRLAPGAVIGGDLDLRACAHLQGFPRGVKVGGDLLLPAHLFGQAPAGAGQPAWPRAAVPTLGGMRPGPGVAQGARPVGAAPARQAP